MSTAPTTDCDHGVERLRQQDHERADRDRDNAGATSEAKRSPAERVFTSGMRDGMSVSTGTDETTDDRCSAARATRAARPAPAPPTGRDATRRTAPNARESLRRTRSARSSTRVFLRGRSGRSRPPRRTRHGCIWAIRTTCDASPHAHNDRQAWITLDRTFATECDRFFPHRRAHRKESSCGAGVDRQGCPKCDRRRFWEDFARRGTPAPRSDPRHGRRHHVRTT